MCLKHVAAFLLALGWAGSASAQNDVVNEWYGTIRVQSSPTSVEGEMTARIALPNRSGLSISCYSAPSDYSFEACMAHVWGPLQPPPARVRNVIVSLFKDGERIASNIMPRESISNIEPDLVTLSWATSAGQAGNFWQILAEGGDLTFQFLDANGLGQSIAYADYTFDIAPLPARAIETVRLMRASNLRPRQWAIEILGSCAGRIDSGSESVTAYVTGTNFEHEECVD